MLSLKLVMAALIPVSAAILSISAWYQWSPQVSQLNVPVGPGVAAADAAAAWLPAAAGTEAAGAAALGDGLAPRGAHAARDAAVAAVAPTPPGRFRKSRRSSCLFTSSIPSSSYRWD